VGSKWLIGSVGVVAQKEAIVPTRQGLLTAVAGKGVERGLEPEWQEDGTILLRYDQPQDERQDNLHKQSIRSLVQRIGPDWKIHIFSHDNGFGVEVRPKPGAQTIDMPTVAPVESHESVEPGPVTEDREIDLDDKEQLKKIALELQGILTRLGVVVLGTSTFLQ